MKKNRDDVLRVKIMAEMLEAYVTRTFPRYSNA